MNGVAEFAVPFSRRQTTSAKTAGDRLECVTGGNLRVPPLVDVRPNPLHGRRASVGARHFEAVEAQAIDRLEWKLVLKARLGAGVQLAGQHDRALAIQVRAVALETQGAGRSSSPAGRLVSPKRGARRRKLVSIKPSGGGSDCRLPV